MKNWKKASLGALCVVSLLAGCGMQGGDTNNNDKNADEPKEISLEQVRADNIPEKLLEDHDTVTVSIQGTDQDSKETYTAKVQYTRDDKGNLLLASHYSYTADSPVGEDEFFAQACLSIEGNGVYLSKMESDGRLNMNCYPSGEYESYIQAMLPACGELQDDWYGFLDQLKAQDLSGKKVALFGCGDSGSYPDTFCDAVGLIYDGLQQSGCTFVGAYAPEGYDETGSLVCRGGKFVGLAVDESAPDKTDRRVAAWCEQIKNE